MITVLTKSLSRGKKKVDAPGAAKLQSIKKARSRGFLANLRSEVRYYY